MYWLQKLIYYITFSLVRNVYDYPLSCIQISREISRCYLFAWHCIIMDYKITSSSNCGCSKGDLLSSVYLRMFLVLLHVETHEMHVIYKTICCQLSEVSMPIIRGAVFVYMLYTVSTMQWSQITCKNWSLNTVENHFVSQREKRGWFDFIAGQHVHLVSVNKDCQIRDKDITEASEHCAEMVPEDG